MSGLKAFPRFGGAKKSSSVPEVSSALESVASLLLEAGEDLTRAKEKGLLAQVASSAQGLADGGPQVFSPGRTQHLVENMRSVARAMRNNLDPANLFLLSASYDLRAPLGKVIGALESLSSEWCAREDVGFWRECLRTNVLHLQMLMEDYNDGLLAQQGGLELERQEVHLTALAREATRQFGVLFKGYSLRCEGDDLYIVGDPERLRRLVFNLLSYAAKNSREGTEIKVDVWRRGDNACLFVQDQGQGAIAADTERLFLPFTCLDTSVADAEGQGLSLASVKRVAQVHGAGVCIQGAPGRGTTVEVCFKLLNREATVWQDESDFADLPSLSEEHCVAHAG
jgi:signal transduction histidine kinase